MELGDAEVAEPRLAVRSQQDVRGLHVAVHDPLLVHVREGVGEPCTERGGVL